MNNKIATFKKQTLYLDSEETFYLLRLRLYTRRRHKKLFKHHSKTTNKTNHKMLLVIVNRVSHFIILF